MIKLSIQRGPESINVYKNNQLVAIKPIGSKDPIEVYEAVVFLYESKGYIVNDHLIMDKVKLIRH